MKFTCSVDINKNVALVKDTFLNPDTLQYYQDGFKSKELISGSSMKEGAKSKIVYEKLELVETIITNNLPEEFSAFYEHKHMTNTMTVQLLPIDENKTRYITKIHYTKFNGLLIKTIAKLLPFMFKKQVDKWSIQFKNYVESI